jgi:rhodanese-related sulfurtransferase
MHNKIGFFQLDNLITNRVPFMFYNMAPSLQDWYKSVSRMHVENHEQKLDAEAIEGDLMRKRVPKDYAIILLCQDGQISDKIAQKLVQDAYTNVYVVDGGYQQMMTERNQA